MVKTLKSLILLLGSLCPLLGMAQEERSSVTADFPCPPDGITITKFRDNVPASLFKKWKVVVNREFCYKATPKNNTDNWTWALGDLNAAGDGVVPFWMFQNPLNSYSGTGIIPLANLPPNNSDFGPAHGHIQATANLNGLPEKDLSDADQTVKVFFNKDDVHPGSGEPNWFHYWSQINVPQFLNFLTIPSIPTFDIATCNFIPPPAGGLLLNLEYDPTLPYDEATMAGTAGVNTFYTGQTFPSAPCAGNLGNVITNIPPNSALVRIGRACGFAEANPADPSNPFRGIHVFYKTIAHESEHATIFSEVWSTGYASNWDMDDDMYRDDYEDDLNALRPPNPGYAFSVGPDDSMNDIYGFYMPNLLGQNPALYTAGTEYEEWRCRLVENTVNLNDMNAFDWSYDPTGVNQGKQW